MRKTKKKKVTLDDILKGSKKFNPAKMPMPEDMQKAMKELGKNIKVLAEGDGAPPAARQKKILAEAAEVLSGKVSGTVIVMKPNKEGFVTFVKRTRLGLNAYLTMLMQLSRQVAIDEGMIDE